jgi:hypothetical protein
MATRHIVSVVETTLPFEGTIDEYRCARRRFPRQDDPTRPRHIAVDIPNDRIPTLCRAKSVLLGLPARSRVRWMRASIAATALLICLASPAGARADTRTATATDGVDPGAAFDVAQVNAQTNRDAGTFSLQVKLHTPVPTSFDVLGGPHYLVVWANDADAGQCLSTAGKAGDVYVNVEPSMLDGSLQATVNTKFRQTPSIPPDKSNAKAAARFAVGKVDDGGFGEQREQRYVGWRGLRGAEGDREVEPAGGDVAEQRAGGVLAGVEHDRGGAGGARGEQSRADAVACGRGYADS